MDFLIGRRNYTAGGPPSVFAYEDTLPRNGVVVPRGRFVYEGNQTPPPPPPREFGPLPRHLAEAPWHAHQQPPWFRTYGPRGDGDSSGDGGEDEYHPESESSENPWAEIE